MMNAMLWLCRCGPLRSNRSQYRIHLCTSFTLRPNKPLTLEIFLRGPHMERKQGSCHRDGTACSTREEHRQQQPYEQQQQQLRQDQDTDEDIAEAVRPRTYMHTAKSALQSLPDGPSFPPPVSMVHSFIRPLKCWCDAGCRL